MLGISPSPLSNRKTITLSASPSVENDTHAPYGAFTADPDPPGGNGGYPQSPVTTSLSLLHRYDEGAGASAADASGEGNVGTLTSGAAFDADGFVDLSADNARVSIPDAPELRAAQFSILVGFQIPALSTLNAGGNTLLTKGDYGSGAATNDNYNLYLVPSGGTVNVFGRFEESNNTKHTVQIASGLSAGAWVTAGIRYNGAELSAWLNGSKGSTLATSATPNQTATEVTLGFATGSPSGRDFDGGVAALAIHDAALSDQEMADQSGYITGLMVARELTYPTLTFGVVSDVHYADKADGGGADNRQYRSADDALGAAVAAFNTASLPFAVMLGDFSDGFGRTSAEQAADLAHVESVADDFAGVWKYCLGNHDLEQLSWSENRGATAHDNSHYSFDWKGYHFVVLDPTFSSDQDDAGYDTGNFVYTDAYIPPVQRSWLASDLTTHAGKPTVVFCHNPLNSNANSLHVLDNAAAIRTILEAHSDDIVVVLHGHGHANQDATISGVRYVTLEALVDNAATVNTYATVTLNGLVFSISGSGNQTTI